MIIEKFVSISQPWLCCTSDSELESPDSGLSDQFEIEEMLYYDNDVHDDRHTAVRGRVESGSSRAPNRQWQGATTAQGTAYGNRQTMGLEQAVNRG